MENNKANTVASTILEQLGGNKFIAMTGAHTLTGSTDALSFRIGKGAKNGINGVRVTLSIDDTYTACFYRIRGTKVTVVANICSLHAEDLQRVFTEITDFRTSL